MTVASSLAGLATALGIAGLVDIGTGSRRATNGSTDGRSAHALRLLAAGGRALRRRLGARAPAGLAARIAAAGAPAGLGPREVMAAKLAAAAGGACAALPLAALAPGRLGLAVSLGGPVAGFLGPDWWLARRGAERARRVRRDLPILLDLLRVSVEAGLSPVAALAAVGARSSGPLAQEWSGVGREAALGVPLAEVLDGVERRVPLPEVSAARTVTAPRSARPSPRRRARRASPGDAASRRRPRRRVPRSSSWWRCCSSRRCCCWSRLPWRRRCSAAAGCPASTEAGEEGPAPEPRVFANSGLSPDVGCFDHVCHGRGSPGPGRAAIRGAGVQSACQPRRLQWSARWRWDDAPLLLSAAFPRL